MQGYKLDDNLEKELYSPDLHTPALIIEPRIKTALILAVH